VIVAQAVEIKSAPSLRFGNRSNELKIQKTAQQVKYALGKGCSNGGLALVMVKDWNLQELREYSSKLDLETACLSKAGHHFTQAFSTPLLLEPLVSIFGETGNKSKAFDEVLSDMFQVPESCDDYVWKVIAALQQLSSVQSIMMPMIIEYEKGWQHTHEGTSSSPLHIHFGHYMVAIAIKNSKSSMPIWPRFP